MVSLPELKANCAQCAALCCVAPAFDRSSRFAIDKPAATPCPNLKLDHSCGIHARLNERGFGGCVQFDCLGAGQYVVQHIFKGQSWRDHPALAPRMFEAFRVMRRVYEALELLQLARDLPLSTQQAATLRDLQAALWPDEGWSEETLHGYERGPLPKALAGFLQGLRDRVAGGR